VDGQRAFALQPATKSSDARPAVFVHQDDADLLTWIVLAAEDDAKMLKKAMGRMKLSASAARGRVARKR